MNLTERRQAAGGARLRACTLWLTKQLLPGGRGLTGWLTGSPRSIAEASQPRAPASQAKPTCNAGGTHYTCIQLDSVRGSASVAGAQEDF
jgi:hypothetical protein